MGVEFSNVSHLPSITIEQLQLTIVEFIPVVFAIHVPPGAKHCGAKRQLLGAPFLATQFQCQFSQEQTKAKFECRPPRLLSRRAAFMDGVWQGEERLLRLLAFCMAGPRGERTEGQAVYSICKGCCSCI